MKPYQFLMGLALASQVLVAAPPEVQTVPWVAGNPLISHDTWVGKIITLKGACIPSSGAVHTYSWDFGDGSPVASANVNLSKPWVIEATHAYMGAIGTVITARLTVTDTSTGESATTPYYLTIRDRELQVETNVAIDEGLWYLHKNQIRSGLDGSWSGAGNYHSVTAINVNSFEANGHLEGGDSSNPYTETVRRGMRWCLQRLESRDVSALQAGEDPDTNGNDIGIYVNQYPEGYQNGIFMDVLVASGTPAQVAGVGAANIMGRTYKEIVQDMCDNYAWSQYDGASGGVILGGWRYSPGQAPDNSACQWAAIGMLAAESKFGCVVPDWVKTRVLGWLAYSQRPSDGVYGYTNSTPLFSYPYGLGTTPSGLVECAFAGVGRGNSLWDKSETLMRNRWGTGGDHRYDPLLNYYGLFAFVKAMQLHDSNGDGVAEPLTLLKSSTPGVVDLDWYSAEVSMGDPLDGLARTVVDDQNSNGSWSSTGWFDTYNLQTARAILMLNPDVLGSGNPVAVALANPNPAVAGQSINLDGTNSFHGNPANHIVLYEWDLDNDGIFDVSGPFATVSFPSVADYPVTLRVTDDNSPAKTDSDIIIIRISTPPLAPTADAGGPYVFCPEVPTWYLDGTGSANPDDGLSEPGQPGDAIQSYEWDLDGDGQFDDASGAQPDVTAFMTGLGVGSHVVQLKVTDTTATSFPSSSMPDLTSVDSAIVEVKAEGECTCISNLAARPKAGKIQLTWTYGGADHHNVYRSTMAGGPYTFIASTKSTYSTYLDQGLVNGTTYYYVVREANELDQEQCQSNEASGTSILPRSRTSAFPQSRALAVPRSRRR